MINSAGKSTISDTFSSTNTIKYVIPRYQREYTWKKENWEDLINDIDESDGDHFIGSIICVYKNTQTAPQATSFEIIDGQQRLTTITLLYCSIIKLLKDKSGENQSDNLKYELLELKNMLVIRDSTEPKLELSSQNNNNADYKSILSEVGVLDYQDNNLNKGNRQIYRAYYYYLNKLSPFTIEELRALLKKIFSVSLVRIEVNTTSDAFILFESLNNRGIPLTAVDLIKNKLLAEVDKKGLSVDDAFSRWKQIIDKIPEYKIQERFLRQFYNAFKWNNQIKVEGTTKATKTTLIHIYENLLEKDLDFIFNELEVKASIYSELINFESSDFETELRDLANIQAAPGYALLMFLFSKHAEAETLKNVINLLVKYFVRRNITDFPNTRNLDQIFIDLTESMGRDETNISYEYIIEYLTNKERFSSIDDFKEKLKGDLYELNVDATRFILSEIEKQHTGTKEKIIDFWKRGSDKKLVWTIEHIFPEGGNIPKPWIYMIADGDKSLAKSIQDRWVHKLGNLTLTGFNQKLSNFDYIKKKERTDQKRRFIGYKNGLYLNEELVNKDKWTEDDIKNRTEKLVDEAIRLFKVEKE